MFQIIPVLPVEVPAEWCEPQGCYTAAVWWGDVLLKFYTSDKSRIDGESLNRAACDVLREITKAIAPGSDTVIDAGELAKAIGHPCILWCRWSYFSPPVAVSWQSWCVIPVDDAALVA